MLQLRSTAKVLNQQSRWGRVSSRHKVLGNLQPRLLWINTFQYLRYTHTHQSHCVRWIPNKLSLCGCLGVLTGTGVHRAPPYTQAALPKSARTRRPPKQHFHPGPGSSATCTEKTVMVLLCILHCILIISSKDNCLFLFLMIKPGKQISNQINKWIESS